MTTGREEALELARESGFIGPIWKDQFQDSFMRLVRLAKQRGAEESLELLIEQGFIQDDGTETSYAKKARAAIKKAEEML